MLGLFSIPLSRIFRPILGFLEWLILFSSVAHADFKVPRLNAPVVDQAQLLSAPVIEQLNHALIQFRARGGAQIGVLIVSDLENLSIEQAAIEVAEKWRLGSEQEDDGVVLLVAPHQRQMRIEVGQGLEGKLTDAYSKRIIDETMAPYFKRGDFSAGVIYGLIEIARYCNPEISFEQFLDVSKFTRPTRNSGIVGIFFLIFVFLIFIVGGRWPTIAFLLGASLGRGRGLRSGSSWSGGGFGSGGGFSGGGGGFSGGGASGRW